MKIFNKNKSDSTRNNDTKHFEIFTYINDILLEIKSTNVIKKIRKRNQQLHFYGFTKDLNFLCL